MNINPRLILNKKTGKLLLNYFVPRPLQEIERELVFDIDFLQQLLAAKDALNTMGRMYLSDDYSRYQHLFRKREAYYSLLISQFRLRPLDLFTQKNSPLPELDGYLQALEYALQAKYDDFLAFNKTINKMLVHDPAKKPGEFRNTLIVNNTFCIPVHPHEIKSTLYLMSSYADADTKLPNLIKAALIYYQYLVISPFLDGNHRQARILLLTYFRKTNLCHGCPFSISKYLYLYKTQYRKAIDEVRFKGDYQNWLHTFIIFIQKAAQNMTEILERTKKICEKNRKVILNTKYSNTIKKNLLQILSYLELNPVVDIKTTSLEMDKTYPTIANCFDILQSLEILHCVNDFKRNRLYQYREHFNNIFDMN
jgi:hypothetical protein